MIRHPSFVVSLMLVGCAPTTQELHLGRIEHRVARAEPSAAERRDALGAVVSSRHLDRRRLVRAVLSQNPSLDSARAAWRAAVARYHEKDALPDPVLSYTVAPGSIFDPDVHFGQIIQLSQTIPWVGKMGSRGDVELYRAEMKAHSYAEARLELALEACRLFDRYYAIARSLEVVAAHDKLVAQLGKALEAQYAVGKGTLYEPLQIEVERTQLERQTVGLEAERAVVQAQLNALLHRPPGAKLPPPPDTLADAPAAPPQDTAERVALAERPELLGADAEHKSLEAAIDLAQRDYVPDFTLFGSYNSMWAMPAHQFMFGISAPLPLSIDRRAGAESAARAQLAENEHREVALVDRVRAEVFQARARLHEARTVARLYAERLLPLAKVQAQAVRPAFVAGDVSFAQVIAAERGHWNAVREWHQALALAQTRAAELERAMGKIPGLGTGGGDR